MTKSLFILNDFKIMLNFPLRYFFINHLGSTYTIISNDYNLNLKEASWSFLAQSLTVTALVLPMGRFSDIIGRKKSLILSMSLFSVGSFICFSSYLFSFLYLVGL